MASASDGSVRIAASATVSYALTSIDREGSVIENCYFLIFLLTFPVVFNTIIKV